MPRRPSSPANPRPRPVQPADRCPRRRWFSLCALLDRQGSADAAFHQMTIERARESNLAAIRSWRPRIGASALASKHEPPSLRPVDGFLLVQNRLPIRTDDAKADKIAGLDAEDIHPEDQRRRARWQRPVRHSAVSNRFHIGLPVPEPRIVEGHVFIGNIHIGTPERLLLASTAGTLEATSKGIDHLPVAPHRQMHMGKLGPPRQPDQSERTPLLDSLAGPYPNTAPAELALLGRPAAVMVNHHAIAAFPPGDGTF